MKKDTHMQSDDAFKDLFKPAKPPKAIIKKRIDQVVRNVRHEHSTDDILTFSFGKSFTALMTILAPLFAIIDTQTHKRK